jgi:hypothetical protein
LSLAPHVITAAPKINRPRRRAARAAVLAPFSLGKAAIVLTFFPRSDRITPQREADAMKDFFKGLFGIMLVAAAFFVGYKVGKSKEKAKIPNFQDEI